MRLRLELFLMGDLPTVTACTVDAFKPSSSRSVNVSSTGHVPVRVVWIYSTDTLYAVRHQALPLAGGRPPHLYSPPLSHPPRDAAMLGVSATHADSV